MKVATKLGRFNKQDEHMSDESFVDLKEALEALEFERGEHRDLQVTGSKLRANNNEFVDHLTTAA